MQIYPVQDMQDLTVQLTDLMEKIKTGSAGDIVQQLQLALETLSAMATQDAVTGALNRRGLVQKLDGELERAKRTGHPFSFGVIEVDRFQALNDKYGSAVGDQILKCLAQAALKILRSLDSVGRISDRRLAIILPTTWLDQSENAIQRLTGEVSSLNWAVIAPGLSVTFSTGLTANAYGDTAEQMIARACEALEMARVKGAGSNVQLEQALPSVGSNLQ